MNMNNRNFSIMLLKVFFFTNAFALSGKENEGCKELATAKELQEILRDTSHPLVVLFYTPWCPACKGMIPVINQAAQSYDQVHFAKADITKKEFNTIVDALGIEAIPTVIYKETGYKPKEQFNKRLEAFANSQATDKAQKAKVVDDPKPITASNNGQTKTTNGIQKNKPLMKRRPRRILNKKKPTNGKPQTGLAAS